MTTLAKVRLSCPVCESQFDSQAVVTTNSFGGKRTDFHERAAGVQPLPHKVHACWTCGYAGHEDDFRVDDADFPRDLLHDEMTRWRGRPLVGSEKYEAAAHAAFVIGHPDRVIADHLLHAAWCCVDEDDVEAERYFRIAAAKRFEQALASFDGVAREERAVITYLVGELWRRAGFTQRAATWFDAVPREITDSVAQRWVLDAAVQQRNAPKEWFA